MSLMICSEGVFAVPDFCLIFAPRLATMSQKSSFPHPADSAQYVLTSNRPKGEHRLRNAWQGRSDQIKLCLKEPKTAGPLSNPKVKGSSPIQEWEKPHQIFGRPAHRY